MTQKHVTALPLVEEQALIRAAQDRTDPATREAALDRLFEAYGPAVRNASRRYRDHVEPDDLAQESYLAFIEVVESHDPESGARLAGRVAPMLTKALDGAASAASSVWSIPDRTVQRFYAILRRADGDVSEGARIASSYEMDPETFLAVANVLRNTGSLTPPHSQGEKHELTSPARPVAGAPSDAYADLDRSLTAHALLGEIADDPAATAIVRYAYGFDDVYVDGTLIDPVVPDGTVSQIMPFPTEKGTAWTRPTVQRRRVAALALMREKHELTNTKETD